MFINKIKFLDSTKQSDYYKTLASFFMDFFSKDYYKDEKDLQKDFEELQRDESFLIIAELAAKHCEKKTGVYIPGEEIALLPSNRWKLCIVCGKPFLSYDRYNKTKICYSASYRRFKRGQGVYFKSASNGVSQCYMDYRNEVVKRSVGKS